MNHYSIEQHKRLRPKPTMKNKNKISDIEREYLDYFALSIKPCFVCETIENVQGHHVKEHSTDRKDHTKLLPLCEEHHTGTTFSPHGTPRSWREAYSIEFQREVAEMHFDEFMESRA